MLSPDAALSVGLVDRLAPVDRVVPAALEWCEQLTELPSHALRETRRTVRRDLMDIVERSRSGDVDSLVAEWFRPEVQGPLRALAEQLRSK
jgi:enoyl-CoA hydratase/carnithine racemase